MLGAVQRARTAVVLFVLLAACAGRTHRAAVPDPAPQMTPTTSASATSTVPRFVPPVRIEPVPAPPQFLAPAAQWLRVTRPDGGVQLVAVMRPRTRGVHPVVVYLHGSSGLASVQLAWAQQLVDAGFVVVAGCYLDASTHTPAWLRCPGLPDETRATDAQMQRGYHALVDTAAALPDLKHGEIGLVGVSQGGIVALTAHEPRVVAIVADSAYGQAGAAPVGAPVLLLGMTMDPAVSHARVVLFEQALRAAGKPVASHYYDGYGHAVTLTSADATSRAVQFLERALR
jgi:dienelactone hydrolase